MVTKPNGTAITSDANHDDNEMVVTKLVSHAPTIDKNQNVGIGPDSDAEYITRRKIKS